MDKPSKHVSDNAEEQYQEVSLEDERTASAPPLRNFVGNNTKRCLVLEIFAGSCRVSKACRDIGLRVAAKDKDVTRPESFSI